VSRLLATDPQGRLVPMGNQPCRATTHAPSKRKRCIELKKAENSKPYSQCADGRSQDIGSEEEEDGGFGIRSWLPGSRTIRLPSGSMVTYWSCASSPNFKVKPI